MLLGHLLKGLLFTDKRVGRGQSSNTWLPLPVHLLPYILLESCIFLFYFLVFVGNGAILFILKVDEAFFKLLSCLELTLDELGIGANDVLNLLLKFNALVIVSLFFLQSALVD